MMCQCVPSEPPRSDLGAPDSTEVDHSPTEDAKGSQISDPVNSPSHYNWLPFEVIEITEHMDFLLGNVIKYVLRADHKGKPLEDLKKAEWYLRREIAKREREGDTPSVT